MLTEVIGQGLKAYRPRACCWACREACILKAPHLSVEMFWLGPNLSGGGVAYLWGESLVDLIAVMMLGTGQPWPPQRNRPALAFLKEQAHEI